MKTQTKRFIRNRDHYTNPMNAIDAFRNQPHRHLNQRATGMENFIEWLDLPLMPPWVTIGAPFRYENVITWVRKAYEDTVVGADGTLIEGDELIKLVPYIVKPWTLEDAKKAMDNKVVISVNRSGHFSGTCKKGYTIDHVGECKTGVVYVTLRNNTYSTKTLAKHGFTIPEYLACGIFKIDKNDIFYSNRERGTL